MVSGIQEERKESLKEKSLITKVREQAENRDPRDKRVNTKLDTLLLLLHEDLALLQQWELEEYHKATRIYIYIYIFILNSYIQWEAMAKTWSVGREVE